MNPEVARRDCLLVSHKCAAKQVRDMHYEGRIGCVHTWYAEKRKIRMDKKEARKFFMEPWQYLQVV